MNDIFLSYASEDRDAARKLMSVFAEVGWSVFWDRETPVGTSWDRVVEDQLRSARAVTPLWSPRSVASDWVMIEATEGMEQRKLFPVLIDPTPIPLRFKLTQFADLSDWDGSATHEGCARLLRALAAHLGTGLPSPVPTHETDTAAERRSEGHDVFLGYARSDEAKAKALVSALSAANIRVWWDRAIVVGESFDNTILRALEQARSVIILWSHIGVGSDWVKAEAQWAMDRGVLINAFIDEAPLPPGFSAAPSVDLTNWDGETITEALQQLRNRLVNREVSSIGRGDSWQTSEPRHTERRRRAVWVVVVAIALTALTLGVYIGLVIARGG